METKKLIQDLNYARYALGEAQSNMCLISQKSKESLCEGDEEMFQECRDGMKQAIEHVRKQEKKINTILNLDENHWVWRKLPRSIMQAAQRGVRNGKELREDLRFKYKMPEWLEKECDLMEAHIPAGGWVILIMKALDHEYETKVNDHADTK